MNNYVYIIAGLPDFTPDWRQGEKTLDEYIEQVRELLSAKDNEVIDISLGNLDSSLCFIQPSVSHDVLCIEVK